MGKKKYGNPSIQEILVLTSGDGSLSDHISSENSHMTDSAQVFNAIISDLQKEIMVFRKKEIMKS